MKLSAKSNNITRLFFLGNVPKSMQTRKDYCSSVELINYSSSSSETLPLRDEEAQFRIRRFS